MKTYTRLFYLCFALIVFLGNLAISQNVPPSSIKPLGSNSNITLEFIDQFIENQMELNHISGMAASVIVGDKVVWTKEAGLANRETGMEVTDSTLFLTYSVSKMFTGLSLMQQYDKGLFELDDNINDYLPFDVVHPQYPETPITFRMLMTHTAGVSEPGSLITSVMVEGYDYPGTLHDFIESFFVPGGEFYSESHFSSYEPGTQFFYSNVGATLAGYLTECISGIPFNDYCKDSLLIPMGMDNSSYLLADINMDNLAVQYEHNGSNYIPQGHISNAALPAGFLRTSNKQMANFVKTLVNDGNFEGTQIIEESTLDTMTSGHIFPNQNIGLLFGYDHNFDVWGHTGGLSVEEIKTMAFYHKEEQWGVSLLTNGGDDIYGIAYLLMQYAREFSALSLSSFTVDDENGNELLETDEESDLHVSFRCAMQQPITNAKVILRCNHENITVIDSIFTVPTINPDQIISNEGNPFKILVNTVDEPEEIVIEFIYFQDNELIGKEQYPIYTGHPTILLIDDEEHIQRNISKSITYYRDAFESLNIDFYFRNLKLSPISDSFINQFASVIWFTGIKNGSSNILPQQAQNLLIQYLDQGGNLFLSSQHASSFCGNTNLFNNYLKVNHLENSWPGPKYVKGVENDTISDGLEFYITGGDGNNSAYSPSVIEPTGDASAIFNYASTNNCSGVRNAEEDYKTVYLSFGIEAVDNAEDRKEILNRSLNWFGDMTVGFPDTNYQPESQDIFQIYPNPTNGKLNIQLFENVEEIIKINITDLAGKQYFSRKVNPGNQKFISIEDLNIPAGIYLINIKTNLEYYSQKLIFGF